MRDAGQTRIGSLMLIDDNSVDQMLYKRLIDKSGLVERYMAFQYAEKALEYLKDPANSMPDLILLDINMPRMDGFEFLDAAEAAFGPAFRTVVVMVTTSLDPRDEERVRKYRAVKRFLNKPLTRALLQELVELV